MARRDEYSDGPGRLPTTLMTRRDGMRTINSKAMEELICQHVYGQYLTVRVRGVVDALIHAQAKYQCHVTAEKLNEVARELIECKSRPAVRRAIKRAVDLGLFSEEKEGRQIYYYFAPAQSALVHRVLALKVLIPSVVVAQLSDELNPTAGSDLIPEGCYYNVIEWYPENKKNNGETE